MDIEEQYEKIYRYCYHRLHDPQQAEDITQETFLRWFASDTYRDTGQVLQYLYTIARNLCIDKYRQQSVQAQASELPRQETDPLLSIALKSELDRLSVEDRELLLLRYVNDVPMKVLCKLYGQSRFALHRRIRHLLKALQDALN